MFVPGGLWHAVINLEDTIAVTQNVMTHENFTKVWRATRCERPKFATKFLEDMKDLVCLGLFRMSRCTSGL